VSHGRQRITVFDTTLRDGEQSPGCSMNVQEKVRLGRQLDQLGVDVIEAAFPIASDGDFAAVQAIALQYHGRLSRDWLAQRGMTLNARRRALESAIRPRIHVVLATSDIHLQHKLRIHASSAWSRQRTQYAWRGPCAMTLSFRRKMPRAQIPNFCFRCWKP